MSSAIATTAYWRAAGTRREKTKKHAPARGTTADTGRAFGFYLCIYFSMLKLRVAGMTYLKYANLCAEVVRAQLKEPFLSKACSPRLPFPIALPWVAAAGWSAPGRCPPRWADRRRGGPQAKPRETVYYKATSYVAGKAEKPGAWRGCS